jgi:hypothetical protein
MLLEWDGKVRLAPGERVSLACWGRNSYRRERKATEMTHKERLLRKQKILCGGRKIGFAEKELGRIKGHVSLIDSLNEVTMICP